LAIQLLSKCANHFVKRPVVVLQLDHGRRLNALAGRVQYNLPGQIRRRTGRRTLRRLLRANGLIRQQDGKEDERPKYPVKAKTDAEVFQTGTLACSKSLVQMIAPRAEHAPIIT